MKDYFVLTLYDDNLSYLIAFWYPVDLLAYVFNVAKLFSDLESNTFCHHYIRRDTMGNRSDRLKQIAFFKD